MSDERPLSDRMRTAIDVAASWNDRTMNFEMACDWVAEVAALEAELTNAVKIIKAREKQVAHLAEEAASNGD